MFSLVSHLATAQSADRFETAVTGAWTGTLEYRDYRSDRRVTLPTKLVVEAVGPGQLTFAYTYDDGPGKLVTSRERITIDRAKSTYRIQNGDGTYDATFDVAGLGSFAAASPVIVLSGTGDENGAPVDLRIRLTVHASSLTMLRESRTAGGEWLFRNQYELTR